MENSCQCGGKDRCFHVFFDPAKCRVHEVAHRLIVHAHQFSDLFVAETLIEAKLYRFLLSFTKDGNGLAQYVYL